jgi:hypothetical protein
MIDERATHPSSGPEALEQIMDNFNNLAAANGGSSDNFIDDEDTKEVKEAKTNLPEPTEFSYAERDVLLYNLGVGAKADELQWVYENSDNFQVCSTLIRPLTCSPSLHSVSSPNSAHHPRTTFPRLYPISTLRNCCTANNI